MQRSEFRPLKILSILKREKPLNAAHGSVVYGVAILSSVTLRSRRLSSGWHDVSPNSR
ncbi:MAG: hypothetical protein ACI80E_000629, partial [Oceanospirillaceae bacterium]